MEEYSADINFFYKVSASKQKDYLSDTDSFFSGYWWFLQIISQNSIIFSMIIQGFFFQNP